jgi:hypothetical protein
MAEVGLVGWRIGPGELGEGGPQRCDLVGEVQVRGQYLHPKYALTCRDAGPGLFSAQVLDRGVEARRPAS